MTGSSDDALLARLGGLAREVDPVPPSVLAAARAAFSLRDLDAELATLVLDSAGRGLAGVRGEDDVRLLSYDSPSLGVELQVERHGDGHRVLGQVVGGRPVSVVLQTDGDDHDAPPDPAGVFRADGLRTSRLRVRAVTAGGRTLLTPWLSV